VQTHGALLIADEVMTGFGRTGSLFACQRAGLKPDLMALSKGLTGGFLPMGVTMASERLYRGFISETPAQTFFHGHSFTANPLGCAAALASLDLLQHNPERYQQFDARHIPLLEELAPHPLVKRIRCQGTVAAFELDAGSTGYLNPIGKQLESANNCSAIASIRGCICAPWATWCICCRPSRSARRNWSSATPPSAPAWRPSAPETKA